MIVGDGDIASVLQDDNKIWFASGVSNSQETRESEYNREIELLLKQNKDKHLVYFSSLSIFYNHNRYSTHKRTIESLIKQHFPRYTIVRIGNITWGTNPHTLINAFKNNPNLPIRNEYRYIVDKEEFLYWLSLIPPWSCEMNIPGKRMKVKDIVEEYASPKS